MGGSRNFSQHKLFVKVINQLESKKRRKKKKKKICTTQILFENLFCIKHMQTLTFENYQGQNLLHWYMRSLVKLNMYIYLWRNCLRMVGLFLGYLPSVISLLSCDIKWSDRVLCVVLLRCGPVNRCSPDFSPSETVNEAVKILVRHFLMVTPRTCSSNKSAFHPDAASASLFSVCLLLSW